MRLIYFESRTTPPNARVRLNENLCEKRNGGDYREQQIGIEEWRVDDNRKGGLRDRVCAPVAKFFTVHHVTSFGIR